MSSCPRGANSLPNPPYPQVRELCTAVSFGPELHMISCALHFDQVWLSVVFCDNTETLQSFRDVSGNHKFSSHLLDHRGLCENTICCEDGCHPTATKRAARPTVPFTKNLDVTLVQAHTAKMAGIFLVTAFPLPVDICLMVWRKVSEARDGLEFCSSSIHLPSAVITGVCHHT